MRPVRATFVLCVIALLTSTVLVRAESGGVPQAAADMARAADAFLSSLTPEQRKQASYEFDDKERVNWYFVPRVRNGLTLKAVSAEQRKSALNMLRTGLSQRGYVSATSIMALESVLREIEQGKGPVRDGELYYFTVFGKPESKGTWGWRVEGHHLSINFTLVDGTAVAAAPVFFGVNPAVVREGPKKGTRILEQEEELGRALVKSLTDQQRKAAIIAAEAPKDIITGNARNVTLTAAAGLRMAEMGDVQKQLLTQLIELYAHRLRDELAGSELERILNSASGDVRFAWAGGVEAGQGHYYRIQGPTFLVEYDNTQNNANHIHSVWRDPKRDFGDDLLKRHYEQHKH